ncbi:hypothetical protein SAMN05880590_10213 [Rhizobium sp. RU35A]|nr:hypothetical protein SAMN05880590_10213 [Rhizobium sp. RU35A]
MSPTSSPRSPGTVRIRPALGHARTRLWRFRILCMRRGHRPGGLKRAGPQLPARSLLPCNTARRHATDVYGERCPESLATSRKKGGLEDPFALNIFATWTFSSQIILQSMHEMSLSSAEIAWLNGDTLSRFGSLANSHCALPVIAERAIWIKCITRYACVGIGYHNLCNRTPGKRFEGNFRLFFRGVIRVCRIACEVLMLRKG